MKKLIASVLAVIIMLAPTAALASVQYENPFEAQTQNCEMFRIPAILTLNDGSVIAAADMRYNHGGDSPNNLDTLLAVSADGYSGWQYNIVNYFDDFADSETDAASASFIDSAIGQSKTTNRIFVVTDAYPAMGGVNNSAESTGYVNINGNDYLTLEKNGTDDFCFYVGDFNNNHAPVIDVNNDTATEYTVDREYNLYFNGEPVLMQQIGSEKNVQQNVFYRDSDLRVVCTSYLWLRYSDDNGKTWSSPEILNPQVKADNEGFLGVAPGRMLACEYNGKERIMFTVYNHFSSNNENASVIYSDDNGRTWHRGESTKNSFAAGKASESQLVALNAGVIRMYCRNKGDFVASCDSTDGGVTWSRVRCEESLPGRGNCMLSFINTSMTIDDKNVILGSFPSDTESRSDGVIMVGIVEADNYVNWIETYHVNQGTYAYSCLTELADGNIALLYEDQGTHIAYKILTLDTDGKVSDINGEDIVFVNEDVSSVQQFFKTIKIKLQQFFKLF